LRFGTPVIDRDTLSRVSARMEKDSVLPSEGETHAGKPSPAAAPGYLTANELPR